MKPEIHCEREREPMLATSTSHRPTESRPGVRLEGRDILCFSHDWNGDPLSKTHLMRLLARKNRVLWVNSIGYRAPTASRADIGRAFKKLAAAMTPLREVEPNLHVLSPLAIPAYGVGAIRKLNTSLLRLQVRWAMRRLEFRKPINWTFNPAASLVAGSLGEDMLIYYCVDEYTAFSGVPTEALVNMEKRLLEKADAVFVSADRLYQSKAPLNPRIALVRHGVDFDHFRKACAADTPIPEEIANLPKPIIGYFGLIGRDWVDVPLLESVAKRFAHGSLVMLGKVTMDVAALTQLPNVHLLGRKPYSTLPAYCKGFDVALIPFPISEVTLNANPLKAREYLAAGLPVVSTQIPEVEVLGQCRIGATPDQFATQIEEALRSPGPSVERSATMREHSWQARLDEVLGHLATFAQGRRSSRSRGAVRMN